MYIYRHWHQFGPLALVMAGFYVGHNFAHTSDVIMLQTIFFYFGLLFYTGMMINWAMYQAYLTGMPTGKSKPAAEPDRSVPLNVEGRQAAMIPLGQTLTTLPVIDSERRFARTLIDMRNSNLEVNMKESYWIAGGRFGDSREAFVNMLDTWKYHGVCARVGDRRNATYTVTDWRAVRLIADGNTLPPPPDEDDGA